MDLAWLAALSDGWLSGFPGSLLYLVPASLLSTQGGFIVEGSLDDWGWAADHSDTFMDLGSGPEGLSPACTCRSGCSFSRLSGGGSGELAWGLFTEGGDLAGLLFP